MDVLQLCVGLFVPWTAGFLWLRAAEARLGYHHGANPWRQAGYGLFLGYAVLSATLQLYSWLAGGISFWPVLGLMLLLTAAPAVYLARHHRQPRPATTGSAPAAPARLQQAELAPKLLSALLLLLILWHLAYVAIEIIYRPVYPWDGWQSWVYRAKTWYFQGQLFPLDILGDWNKGSGVTYTMPGHDYPAFGSILPLWCALSLGHWSETLINTPVLLAGIALVMAMYGQCREFGAGTLPALIASYLLISIPLLDTHLALAGQADIWMAGFTGLGYIAVLRGLGRRDGYQLALGLAFTAMGFAVKQEGAIWLLGALAITCLTLWPRLCTATLLICAAIAGLAWLLGVHLVTLPLLGTVGIEGNTLRLFSFGEFSIETFEVWDNYAKSFLLQGNWNLLWPLVLLGLLALVWLPAERSRRTLISFYLVLFGFQYFIFGFTHLGRWAEDGTAINRLLLHFTPAVVFSFVMIWHRIDAVAAARPPAAAGTRSLSASTLLALGCGVLVTAALVSAYLVANHPMTQGNKRDLSAQMHFKSGLGHRSDSGLVIDRFQGGIALASSGKTFLQADQLDMLRVSLRGNQSEAGFFWRRKSNLDTVESQKLGAAGDYVIDLQRFPEWSGEITEVGVIFYDDIATGEITLQTLRFEPRTLANTLLELWHGWTQPELWSQKSVNQLEGGAQKQLLPLGLVLTVILLLSLLAHRLLQPDARARSTALAMLALFTWLLLDARWLANGSHQASATIAYFGSAEPDHLDNTIDVKLTRAIAAARELLPESATTVLLTSSPDDQGFRLLRSRYLILPHSGVVYRQKFASLPLGKWDSLIYLNSSFLAPGASHAGSKPLARSITSQTGATIKTYELPEQLGYLFVKQPRS